MVAVHLPSWTSDPEIEALIYRFRTVGKETRNFGSLKIRPTTPNHPLSRYQQVTIYIFSDHQWTTPESLRQYLTPVERHADEGTFKEQFESSVRGGYHIDSDKEKGWIGAIVHEGKESPASMVHWLFNETISEEHRPVERNKN